MRVGYGLGLEQQQKLIMTPELRQAITILQFSAIELAEYIEQELLENPVLEISEEQVEKNNEDVSQEKKNTEEKTEFDWQEYFENKSDIGVIRHEKAEIHDEFKYESMVSKVPTLEEHLLLQLGLLKLNPSQVNIGEFIIGNLDEYGYLNLSLEIIAESILEPVEKIEEMLELIQAFDPPGVGARSLSECLLIQANYLNINNHLLNKMITNYLEQIGEGKIQRIAAELGVNVQEVQKQLDIIKTLDPKPGRMFSSNEVRYVIPDIVVERIAGEYVIIVNDSNVPRLNISHTYKQVLNNQQEKNEEAYKYVENKLNSASWLIKSIEQRRVTLYKVANCIVDMQKNFFDQGIKCLKPLNLKNVAEEIGVHESTVSRATANKYMQTPQGVFEMKFFFASGVDTTDGEMASMQSIKKIMKEIVDQEDKRKPISDQKIADLLLEKGINISRRTVAKYRDEMGILSTNKRKRY